VLHARMDQEQPTKPAPVLFLYIPAGAAWA